MSVYASTQVAPYVYICTHKNTGKFYIGYRERNVSMNITSDLDFPIYRTSSKEINKKFKEFNWIIFAEFKTGIDAYDFEQQLIYENWNNPLLMNESCHYGKSRFRSDLKGIKKSEKHKEKLRQARRLRAPHSEETKRKISDGNKGKVVPEISRLRIASAKIGSNNPNFGKSPSATTTKKLKLSLKKYYQELKEKNIPHPSTGFNQIRVSCTCCKKTIAVNIFSRFHGNKCKGNKNGD